MTYKFDVFSSGFVSVLAAEQTEEGGNWFQGTADAVRQSLRHMRRSHGRDVMILSGDQLYSMDFAAMLETHRDEQRRRHRRGDPGGRRIRRRRSAS